MARPVAIDPHDRRRSPSQRRTSPSHQLRRNPGEKQRPHSYKPPGQTGNTADSAGTMSGALITGDPHRSWLPVKGLKATIPAGQRDHRAGPPGASKASRPSAFDKAPYQIRNVV
jgi:hypothetical protein